MTAPVIHNIGSHLVDTITGDEVFSCRSRSQRDIEITAQKLRNYFGGDVAAPNIRTERGARATKISEFPNATEFGPEDHLTGLQKGQNVNFSRAQLLAPLVEIAKAMLAGQLEGFTVSTLPEGVLGMEAYVVDGDKNLAIGKQIVNSGAGDTPYRVWYNGKKWTVTGK